MELLQSGATIVVFLSVELHGVYFVLDNNG